MAIDSANLYSLIDNRVQSMQLQSNETFFLTFSVLKVGAGRLDSMSVVGLPKPVYGFFCNRMPILINVCSR